MVQTPSELLAEIAGVGTDPIRGGYSRPLFSAAERSLRDWFIAKAESIGLVVESDRNGIVWAWWDVPGVERTDAIASGSHLDSVPGGGNFDGPLGVVSALSAVAKLKADGHQPVRPLVVLVFPEEEGSQFGIACLGSLLITGGVSPERVRALQGQDGATYAERALAVGEDPQLIGPDPAALSRLKAFVELHIEQGIGLINMDQPVAIAGTILGHGRWRVHITGHGDHAGTTPMAGRQDPVVVAAQVITATREAALKVLGARGTVGRIEALPGGTNVIASQATVWLDVRDSDDDNVRAIVAEITERAQAAALVEGCQVEVSEESFSPTVNFDADLRERMHKVLPEAPLLDTGAGHDAGVLSTEVPAAMLFVRNPTGISHSPLEYASDEDINIGGLALAEVLRDLSS